MDTDYGSGRVGALQKVVDRITAPQNVHIIIIHTLIPETSEYVTLAGKGDVAGVITGRL